MTAETRPPTGQDGSPPFRTVAVHEVQPPEAGDMSFKEMEYRWPGEWIVAQVIPNSKYMRTVYQAPDYVPSPQEEEPSMGFVLVHSKNEDELQPELKRENAPVKVFKSVEVNRTQRERDLVLADELGMDLRRIPRKITNLLKGSVFDKEEKRWKDGTQEALRGVNGIIEPHMDWAEAVLADPEKYWHYDTHWLTGDEEANSRTRKDYQFWRNRMEKLHPAAEVSAMAGYSMGLRFLGAELVVGDLNPQWSIAYILGNLTNEEIGRKQTWFPPKDLVMEWVAKIRDNEVLYPPKLEELMDVYKAIAPAFWNLRKPKINPS